ncbi:MAG: AAA family ATPase [Chloroflexi bacterium]|nr:AAA family ATPase [Chloroflexota bacterium]
MATTDQVRLLLVEDVPQVVQYIRGLLTTQSTIKLLEVISDGSRVAAQVPEIRPDVVIVDALLQGKVKGLQLAQQLKESGANVPCVVLTVPQQPVEVDPDRGIHGVLSMPFSGYDLTSKIKEVRKDHEAAGDSVRGRVLAVHSPKGGVGKTTIAFNLGVAFGAAGRRVVIVDGSLQFGDVRALLRVPADAPSIVDLPTDRIAESDVNDVVWRDPSGVDILLAPPRIEQHEMISTRDIDKILSMLRRIYDVVVIDTAVHLGDVTLGLLDAADPILEIVTFDATTIHSTIAMADAFRAIGYPATRVRYLLNRADSSGGIDPTDLVRALGRVPEHQVRSDGQVIAAANNQGVPFVLSRPDSSASQDIGRVAAELLESMKAAPVLAGARH